MTFVPVSVAFHTDETTSYSTDPCHTASPFFASCMVGAICTPLNIPDLSAARKDPRVMRFEEKGFAMFLQCL